MGNVALLYCIVRGHGPVGALGQTTFLPFKFKGISQSYFHIISQRVKVTLSPNPEIMPLNSPPALSFILKQVVTGIF